MTKKWSSTASMDGQTKRQASKRERRKTAVTVREAAEEMVDPTHLEDGGIHDIEPIES